MTLKIVNNDLTKEVHSVRIDDGVITVIAVEDGSDVKISDMDSRRILITSGRTSVQNYNDDI